MANLDLTKEELAELAALEKEEADRLAAEAAAEKRQHLDALRLAKKLSAKHGRPGHDFLVLETRLGNVAVRRPVDVEIDTIGEDADRSVLENYVAAIVLEPTPDEIRRLMAEHHGLCGAIVNASNRLLKALREEEAKK